MKNLSDITRQLYGQPMFKLLDKASAMQREGREIIHYEIGDPAFDSPPAVVNSLKQALDQGSTHYTSSHGLPAFREAIAEYTERTLGFRPDLAQILVCPANAIIDFVIRCVANPGDEIILPDPGFPTYISAISYNRMQAVGVRLAMDNGFCMDPDELIAKITDKTRLIIVNSPSNPTGAVLDEEQVRLIYQAAEHADTYVLSDEVYSRLAYDRPVPSAACFDQCRERTIVLSSLSKTYAMSGWRLGYAIGPTALMEKMSLLLQTILSCLPVFTQVGGITALREGDVFIADMLAELRRRRDLLVSGLNAIDGIQCLVPDGAFYAFPRIENPRFSDFEYAEALLQEEGICVLPGSSFGRHGRGFVRYSYSSASLGQIDRTLEKLRNFHKRHE